MTDLPDQERGAGAAAFAAPPADSATPGWLGRGLGSLWRLLIALIWAVLLIIPAVIAANLLGGQPGLVLVIALGFWLFETLVHELGHALTAWAQGWDVHIISVSRLHFLPAQRRFRALPQYSRSRLSGFVLATPRTATEWEGHGFLLFTLGGAFANIAVAAIGLAIVWLLHGARIAPLPVLLTCFSVSSLLYGLANLVPVRWGTGRSSDGGQLVDHLRKRRRPLLAYARARVSGLRYDGVPPRLWDPGLAERILSDDRDPNWLSIAAMGFFSLGRPAKALAALRAALAIKPDFAAPPAAMAFLIALVERDAPDARQWLARCGGEDRYDLAAWRALAVILAVEARPDDARIAVARARKAGGTPDADDEAVFAAVEAGRDPSAVFEAAAA